MTPYFASNQKLKNMRSSISFLLTLVCASVLAQTEVVSSGPIPLGIKVQDYANDRPVDIATICDGFDSDGLPINLVLPYRSQIILFLPSVNTTNADDFMMMRGNSSPRDIENFNYSYQGRTVGYVGSISYAGGAFDRLTVVRDDNYGDDIPPATLEFQWRVDHEPISLHLFLENDEIDEREIYTNEAMANLFGSDDKEQKSYDYWLEQGFARRLDDGGRPLNPVLPQDVGMLSFVSNAPSVEVVRNGESVDFLRTERSFNDQTSYYLGTNKPGTYTITIGHGGKKYGLNQLTYTYTIQYSFWKQGGYYMLGGFGVVLGAFLFYRVNARRKLESAELLKQLADAELKAVRAQLNPHFLFNALNAIQNLFNRSEIEKANDYIVKLSKLLRTVLAQSDEALHSLEDEINLSRLYLELENMRSPFTFQIELDNSVDMNSLVPNMILQPYLENAVIHGIHKHGANEITINVGQRNDQLILKVADNGKPSSPQFEEGKGMALGRSRLDIIRKQAGGADADVKARATSDQGFIVEIRLPLDL